jgi:hypothetical protein
MPSHIYERIGDYRLAATANVAAVNADRAYIERTGTHVNISLGPAGYRKREYLTECNRQCEPDGRARDARFEADADAGSISHLAAVHAAGPSSRNLAIRKSGASGSARAGRLLRVGWQLPG